ncbi:SWI/SNF-related matrix-associated actin-dependent regulator of chromatin subfamily A containing DEAD/H box 1A-like [Mercenaria mercenaria]|uniref:SWI/SNF-related matrix-associated actin-dependent regulator of chromatin subfamily A containing DEAD/H box 1A-like n=1 Tax=Mercenaria mercenaria TaxID=6596 RepID=UPI00234E5E89|nr:SWI/SNF-related matrix-associated actin-dependent regulator of chromatin subfamily A containing DEAD/H box 1A-like [Mercenaria mercenaria]
MSTPSSKLSSLLQYRFVKKSPGSQNGSQSSGSATQSPSQTSTVPPSTPDKRPANLQVTPDSKSSTVPETSSMSSPDSPIFNTRPKLIDRNWNATPEKPSSSSVTEPWLSKQNGQVVNGTNGRQKGGRTYPTFPDDSDDDDVAIIDDFDGKMESLRQMFSIKTDEEIKSALLDATGDVEKAIDILVAPPGKKFKRIRQESQESTAESDSPVQPRKRIRMISSDSGEDSNSQSTIEPDSQGTVGYSLDTQRSDATVLYDVDEEDNSPLTDDQKKKINFLKDCFSDKTEKELRHALSSNDWNIADATVTMSASTTLKAVSSVNKVRAKAAAGMKKQNDIQLEDDDEDEDFSGAESDSDDSIEEEGDSGKKVILSFFEDATLEELMATPGCSKKKSELIVSHRPFGTWENMVEKFVTVKGLTYDLISGCQEVIRIREVVVRLMKRCEGISKTMEKVVHDLIHSNTQLDNSEQITKQPKLLNPDLQLKPFQMIGLNWLRIMHTQEINGILADEMGLGKTIQTISFLAHLLEEGETGPHVIIVPSSTIENWIRECKVWCPSMKTLVYYGSQEERRATRQYIMYAKEDEYNVIITTYNMATGSVEDRALFKKFFFHVAVFDEGHLLKNMSSLRYQNLMRIQANRRLLLTGTPLQNNLLELMSLLCFVMPDMFIGKTEQLKRMFTMISRTNNDEKRSRYEQDRIVQAKQIMKPFVLRRLKSEVMSQLPQKLDAVEYCVMTPGQQEVYDRLIKSFTNQLSDDDDAPVNRSAMLMQLRKAANHPLLHRSHYTDDLIKEMAEVLCEEPSHKDRGALPKFIIEDMKPMSDFEIHKCCRYYKRYLGDYMLDEALIEESGKFNILDHKLDFYRDQGDRVLLFSQFTTILDIMEIFMKRKKIRYIRLDGSTPVPERQRLIDEYNNDKGIFVFLLSTKAGGLGINLTSANVVILHDIDFNPYNDKQAEDRCHRVGQTREVQILRLISKDTVEEAMLKCSQEKLKLEKDVISTDNQGDESGNSKDVASILKQALSTKMNS